MSIPKDCQADIFFPSNDHAKRAEVEAAIDSCLKDCVYTLISVGQAMHYRNYMLATAIEGVEKLQAALAPISGVYMNEYPPEIAREMALD